MNARNLKVLKMVLWLQLALGLMGGFISSAYAHWGAMSVAWVYNYRVDLEKARHTAGFQEPTMIHDTSFDRVIDGWEAQARHFKNVSFLWGLSCLLAVIFAGLGLGLLYGMKKIKPQQLTEL